MAHLWIFLFGVTAAMSVRIERVMIKPIPQSEYTDLFDDVSAATLTLPKEFQVIASTILFGVKAESVTREDSENGESVNSVFFGDQKGDVYWIIYIKRSQQDHPYYVRMEPQKFPYPDEPTPEDEKSAKQIKRLIRRGDIKRARSATEAWARKNYDVINKGEPFYVELPEYAEGGI